jgi:hypothetical protein
VKFNSPLMEEKTLLAKNFQFLSEPRKVMIQIKPMASARFLVQRKGGIGMGFVMLACFLGAVFLKVKTYIGTHRSSKDEISERK